MLKNLSFTTKLFAALIAFVAVIIVMIISISGNKVSESKPLHYVNDNASADNKVEALKTMTADLSDVEQKNKRLEQHVTALQVQNKQSLENLKASIAKQMQQALSQLQLDNQKKQQALEDQLKVQTQQNTPYPIQGSDIQDNTFSWVSDMAKNIRSNKSSDKNTHSEMGDLFAHDTTSHNSKKDKKQTIKPIYTIPVNATLTSATLMTPLVGRVPIDGQLPSPYHFKLVLSAKNLTANGYPMPGVKGAVMSGIASGDMLGSCARGDIHSMTFIFNDGTISTTQMKGSDDTLGYISSRTGNPCIPGTFHSDAGIFLGAQMGLAGIEGYANALSDSQYMSSTTSEGVGIRTLMGDANKAAIGQGASTAAQAAQTWWNRRVQNSFDYVYVPNVNKNDGHVMKIVVNITQQIPIDYNPNARKVSYEDALQTNYNQLD
jgi:hypothetical protein